VEVSSQRMWKIGVRSQKSEVRSQKSEVRSQVAPSKLSKIRFNGLKVQRVDATKRSVVREVGVVR